MSCAAQIICSRQAAGACADYRDPFAGLMLGLYIEFVRMLEYVVADGAFDTVHGNAFAVFALIAFILAGVRADARGAHRHRVYTHDDARSLVPVAEAYLLHVCGDIRSRGALRRAWRCMHLHAAENGMITVLAVYRKAGIAALACAVHAPADLMRVTVVPAANILTNVSADGSEISDKRSRDRMCGLGKSLGHGIGAGYVAELCQGLYGHPSVCLLYARSIGNTLYIHDSVGMLGEYGMLIYVYKIGAARHRVGIAAAQKCGGLLEGSCADMFKFSHDSPSLQLTKCFENALTVGRIFAVVHADGI